MEGGPEKSRGADAQARAARPLRIGFMASVVPSLTHMVRLNKQGFWATPHNSTTYRRSYAPAPLTHHHQHRHHFAACQHTARRRDHIWPLVGLPDQPTSRAPGQLLGPVTNRPCDSIGSGSRLQRYQRASSSSSFGAVGWSQDQPIFSTFARVYWSHRPTYAMAQGNGGSVMASESKWAQRSR